MVREGYEYVVRDVWVVRDKVEMVMCGLGRLWVVRDGY